MAGNGEQILTKGAAIRGGWMSARHPGRFLLQDLALFALLTGCLALAGPGATPAASPGDLIRPAARNVLLITVDPTRADFLCGRSWRKPISCIAYRIRRWTGLSPSSMRGSARSVIVSTAY